MASRPNPPGSRLFFPLLVFSSLALFSADKTRIAVMPLLPKAGVDPATAATITELVSGELVALRKFDMVDRANMDRILKEQALQNSGCTEQACAVKLGNILNVQKLVVGSVSKLGTQTIISLSFVDVERSRVDLSEREEANNDNEILAKVRRLAKKIDVQVNLTGRIVALNPDGTCLANLGRDDGIRKGLSMSVVRLGDAIIDPDTGDFLGRKVLELGQSKVVAVDAGGSLCTLKAESGAHAFSNGDRVVLLQKTTEVERPAPAVRDNRPSSAAKPLLTFSGSLLALGGGAGCLVPVLVAESAYAAYSNLAPNLSASAYADKWTNYQNAVDSTRTLLPAFATVGGVGLALLVTGILLRKPDRVGSVLPYFNGDAVGLAYLRTF